MEDRLKTQEADASGEFVDIISRRKGNVNSFNMIRNLIYMAKHCCRLVWYFVKCVDVQNTSKIKDFLENACQRLTYHSFNWIAFSCLNPATNVFINIFRKVARRSKLAVAYPELVSRGVSKSRKFKWLVKIVASKGVTPPDLKKTHNCMYYCDTMRGSCSEVHITIKQTHTWR